MRHIIWLSLLLTACQAAPPNPPTARPWSEREVVLVGLGDSVTKGFGASPGHAYFDQLQQWLKIRLPHLTATNYAKSTTTSGHHLNKQLPQIPIAPKDAYGLVVVTSGGNDLLHNYGRSRPKEEAVYGASWEQAQPWIERFDQRTTQLLDGLKLRFPGGVRVFLANIYDPTDGQGDIENSGLPLPPWPAGPKLLEAYNQVLEHQAARRPEVYPVDLHGGFMGHGIHHGSKAYFYYANLEDPNDAGYDRLTQLFAEAIELSHQETPLPPR